MAERYTLEEFGAALKMLRAYLDKPEIRALDTVILYLTYEIAELKKELRELKNELQNDKNAPQR